jgi:phosphate starvation-inducible PhoH-like protein|tara:strand:+ start:514 stop:1446 length:933 start_codon:yes stop_codon:yes gene_type:complete
LTERNIPINDIEPVDLLGVNNVTLKVIKERFPNIKIVSRGRNLKCVGEEKDIDLFEEKINLMIGYFKKYNSMTEGDFENIMGENGQETVKDTKGDLVIVHANNGKKVIARTHNQRRLVESSFENDMLFSFGPAGTGKTYTAVALAVRALKNKEVRKIILTRPAVEAGENLGFLPGDLKEKLDPYLQPLYDALRDMIPAEKLEDYIDNNIVQIAPLAFMRGRTLDNAFVILDEAQNATEGQIRMFLTRMGKSAKFIINGDPSQVDLPRNQKSGLVKAIEVLQNIEGIGIIELDENDVIRHRLVKRIIKAFK